MDYRDIDKYFRLVLDDTEADWTFVCPPDYRSIPGKRRRITQFYLDSFAAIPRRSSPWASWWVSISPPLLPPFCPDVHRITP